jgi:lantibiotic biosynthesis dehydratase-like protein
MTDDIKLAPQVLFRCAAWPLDRLDSLNDATLAESARGVVAASSASPGAAADEQYCAQYERSLLNQRRHLWAMTFDDETFRRALTLTNPEFSSRLRTKRFRETRDKSARHLDGALYRYLSRAVGRTEPADVWAGIGLGTWASQTRTRFGGRRYAFGPDLRPFQTLLRGLGRTRRYDGLAPYKVNGTIHLGDQLDYLHRDPASGQVTRRRIEAPPSLRLTIEALEDHSPAPRAELASALADELDVSSELASGLIKLCLDAGLLVGGLDLPTRFNSPWQALAGAARELLEPDARAWWRALVRLRRICRTLESSFDMLSAESVSARLEEVRVIVVTLANTLGLSDLSVEPCLVRCDMQLLHDIQLGPEWRHRLAVLIRDCSALENENGLFERSGELHRARFLGPGSVSLGTLPDPPPWAGLAWDEGWTSWEALWERTGMDAGLGSAIRAWDRWQRTGAVGPSSQPGRQSAALSRGPFGAIVVRPAADGPCFVSGFGQEGAMLFARFDALLSGRAASRHPSTELSRWFQRSLFELEAASGVTLAELVAPLEHRPNALTRPRFTRAVVCPWTVEADEISLRDARLCPPGDSQHAYLLETPDGRRAAVLSLASANLFSNDPLAEALLFTSFRSIPRWIFSIHNIPFARELAAPQLAPAVALASGTSLMRSRLVLTGTELRRFLDCAPAERFVRWQQLAAEWRFPPLLSARRDQEQPLLVARDSPLALEVLFDAAARRSTHIILEALPDEGWLRDDEGKRYLCEIAVPFLWRDNAWTALASPLDPDQPRAGQFEGRGANL